MAKIIVIGGRSSTGKSTSFCAYKDEKKKIDIKGLPPEFTFLVNPINKMLPTKEAYDSYSKFVIENGKPSGNMLIGYDYDKTSKVLSLVDKNKKFKYIVIDGLKE